MTLKVSANQGNQLLHYIRKNDMEVRKQYRNLVSGKRLNEAADNVGRVAQVDHLERQVRGYSRAARNAYEGLQLARTGDGFLAEVSNLMQGMREIAVRAVSDTLNTSDRRDLNEGFVALRAELDSLVKQSTIFGQAILTDDFLGKELYIENDADRALSLRNTSVNSTRLARFAVRRTERVSHTGLERGELEINQAKIRSTVDADDQLSTSMRRASSIAKAEAINDFTQHTNVTARVLENVREGVADVQGGRLDLGHELIVNGVIFSGFDVGLHRDDELMLALNRRHDETGVLASKDENGRIVLTAKDGRNIEVVTHGNAHLITGLRTNTGRDLTTGRLEISSPDVVFVKDLGTGGAEAKIGLRANDIIGKAYQQNVETLSVTEANEASHAITVLDYAFEDLLQSRAYFGGLENRLGVSVSRLNTASQNAYKAKGVIEDTDYAAETAALARSKVLRESYTQMLKNSNRYPARVLELL